MKLEAVSSKSGVLKIIRSSDVFGDILNSTRNYYGTGGTN